MSVAWRQGDQCEVWSNSANAWISASEILEAPTEDYILQLQQRPIRVRKGSIKVAVGSDGQAVKWILPQEVVHVLRRPSLPAPASPGSAAGASAASSSGTRRRSLSTGAESGTSTDASLCKLPGCCRPVQLGLTRSLKPYDTCCKGCAKGRGEHDPNCGGNQAPMLDSAAAARGEDPRGWLESTLGDAVRFEEYIGCLWSSVADGSVVGDARRAWDVIEGRLLQPIGENLHIKERERTECIEQVDPTFSSTESIRLPDSMECHVFVELCRHLLTKTLKKWFPPKLPVEMRSFVRKNLSRVEEVYDFEENQLGKGSFGIVYGVKHKISGDRRVCKKIEKQTGTDGMELEDILHEIERMASLDHPNVIKVYEYFEDANAIYQIMEPCGGGELQDKVKAVKQTGIMLSEDIIRDVIKQVLRALAFMHSKRVMHSDLKPQNIMLVDEAVAGAGACSIKVIDFGLAELFSPDQQHSEKTGGTLLYMAPEVFQCEAVMKSDIWAVGVILYNLITGGYPFMAPWPLPDGKNMQWWQSETMRLIQDSSLTYKQHPHLSSVSPQLLAFLDKLLQKDPGSRPDAAECLCDPWFKANESTPPPLSVGVIQCLQAYSRQPELKKALFYLLAHQSIAPALQELRAVFTHFDTKNLGALYREDLREVLLKSAMRSLEVERILDALDRNDSGIIHWTEFLAAALCFSVYRAKPLIHAAFTMFDQDRDGKVSPDDILGLFAEGDCTEKWASQISAECTRLASGTSSECGSSAKEDFYKYVGAHMNVSSGDSLQAVTG